MSNPADTFRQEATDLLEQLEENLLELEAAPEDRAKVDTVFRALHTIKGSGEMFGFAALARFVHHLESAYEEVRSGTKAVTSELKDFVKQKVGAWKYPRWVDIVEDLPKTATGKIQRFKLREAG